MGNRIGLEVKRESKRRIHGSERREGDRESEEEVVRRRIGYFRCGYLCLF